MSARLLALGIAAVGLVAWLSRPAAVTAPEEPRPSRPAPAAEPGAAAPAAQRRPARDPFRYGDTAPREIPPPAPALEPEPPPATQPVAAAEPLRLSGFVRQGSRLKAVLVVEGATVLAGVGEAAEGYQVLSVDEDAGVRLRAPSGEELLLRPRAR
jgi:hypothetical protein